ncbi:hypothetical protein ACF1BR_00800 [Streptomyces rubiginosohelvolus]|uniref:hypothetical protein n=1 Tax=Streptomyces rubiginosohelvolus TaxID=67362 RepID=UPI0036FCF966
MSAHAEPARTCGAWAPLVVKKLYTAHHAGSGPGGQNQPSARPHPGSYDSSGAHGQAMSSSRPIRSSTGTAPNRSQSTMNNVRSIPMAAA